MQKINFENNNTYKAFIALGNIGPKYKNTRHNAGFLLLDFIEKQYRFDFMDFIERHDQIMQTRKYPSIKLLTIRPQTMMNASGKAAKQALKFVEIEPTDILLFHDDLDLKLGDYKIQLEKSPKVHNGISSVESELGFKNFYRVRIGIESREDKRIKGADFVLGKFTEEEYNLLQDTFKRITKELFTD